jgi:cell wall-associated NlpC family hydrolase
MPTVADVLTVARSWLHTPFAHQGRQKGIRCDCIGLVIEVCREVGLVEAAGLPQGWDHVGYGRFPDSYGLTLHLLAYLTPVRRQDMRVGDIALFQMVTGQPAHMGFLADGAAPFSLVHAFNAKTLKMARVQEHRLNGFWWQKIHSIYRLPLDEAKPNRG